jgi:hypothetical protein
LRLNNIKVEGGLRNAFWACGMGLTSRGMGGRGGLIDVLVEEWAYDLIIRR